MAAGLDAATRHLVSSEASWASGVPGTRIVENLPQLSVGQRVALSTPLWICGEAKNRGTARPEWRRIASGRRVGGPARSGVATSPCGSRRDDGSLEDEPLEIPVHRPEGHPEARGQSRYRK